MQSDRANLPSPRGPLVLLSGPGGTGKTTLIFRLLADKTWPLRLSVSATTRSPRPLEKDGIHYHFWARDRFVEGIQAGAFLEWAEVYGNYYGTPLQEVDPYREQGIGVLLDVDTQGWEQVKRRCPDVVSIFVKASSEATYEKRLRDRETETEASIQKRLQGARRELARAAEYDYQLINDDLETALANLRGIIGKCFEGSKTTPTASRAL